METVTADTNRTDLRERVMGCWLGKAVGGTLGMPYEGESGPLDLDFYRPVPKTMIANDDLDLQILWACLLDEMSNPIVGPEIFIKGWRDHIDFPWDEYGVCKRNLSCGIMPPLSGSYDNWFTNGMGAAIRSELWACLAPGNPGLAAAYAKEDACLDHAGDGLWAEVYLAALQSAAFIETDVRTLIESSFEYIPEKSQLRKAIEDTVLWWDARGDWKVVRNRILENYGHENFTNVTENLAFTVLGLLDGDGDFSRSICTAANCGKDTDCTAATVGALLGILNPNGIEDRWLEPIGNALVLSPEITGIRPPETLDGFTELVLDLSLRLGGRHPEHAEALESTTPEPIPVQLGYGNTPWFGHGWEFNAPMDLTLPEMEQLALDGTCAQIKTEDFESNVLYLEYTLQIDETVEARIFFNTSANCRVFLDKKYVFGRECGRMAPSPHRVPLGQAIDCELVGGSHTLTCLIERPDDADVVEWVVGVADRKNNLQWIPNVFTS